MRMNSNVVNKLLTIVLCFALALSAVMPGTVSCATGTTESTNTSNSDEVGNTDPNGTLGKNSDVGIEVTKSITGVAGKKVKVAFKLKSNDATNIRLKSVYPVIDTTFPFETSGDAYKIVAADGDVEKQKVLSASFEMKARKDISSGYHSVRFIGEYEKTMGDGTLQDYYVIKTINIYFDGVGGNDFDSGDNDSGSDYNDDEPDYDDFDDGDSGYDGGGDEAEAVAPKLIVTGYETVPEKVMAGQTFKITIHIQNTSKSVAVCNGKFLIGNEAGSFTPTSGSSAVFVDSIPAGETGDIEMEMKAGAELAQKNYSLVIKGDFDDGKGNNFTSSDSLTIPVYQEVKFGITEVSMAPEILGVGSEGALMFTINNKSSVGVYNVNVSVKSDAVSGDECYVGNIAGSSSAYATLNVIGEQDNSDTGTVTVVITYEDSDGNEGSAEHTVNCLVSEDGMLAEEYYEDEYYEDEYMDAEFEEDSSASPFMIAAIVVAGLVALGVIIGIIVFLTLRKKKRMAAILEEDGEDDLFDENF